jgi:cell division septum initiation protein DivIVA
MPPELEELLEDELELLEDELEELEELDDELEELDEELEELDEELDELPEDEASVPGVPPQAASIDRREIGIKCRNFIVVSSKGGRFLSMM